MKSVLTWKENMLFEADSDGQKAVMDAKAPLGKGLGMTPKELVLAGLAGCTAMDVIALLKKHKQLVKEFEIEIESETSKGTTPSVFLNAMIQFKITGDVDKAIALESARLSQTKYCGVSAMMSKAFPIHYSVWVNGENVGQGQAQF